MTGDDLFKLFSHLRPLIVACDSRYKTVVSRAHSTALALTKKSAYSYTFENPDNRGIYASIFHSFRGVLLQISYSARAEFLKIIGAHCNWHVNVMNDFWDMFPGGSSFQSIEDNFQGDWVYEFESRDLSKIAYSYTITTPVLSTHMRTLGIFARYLFAKEIGAFAFSSDSSCSSVTFYFLREEDEILARVIYA